MAAALRPLGHGYALSQEVETKNLRFSHHFGRSDTKGEKFENFKNKRRPKAPYPPAGTNWWDVTKIGCVNRRAPTEQNRVSFGETTTGAPHLLLSSFIQSKADPYRTRHHP
jgi:hypothetical protein